MLRWGAVAYAVLGLVALVVVHFTRAESVFVHPDPWLELGPIASHAYSALMGVAFSVLVVLGTRAAVIRYDWARELHGALRPVAASMSPVDIGVIAVLSAFGEELLFRGLLGPLIGVVPQALIFGLAHQIPGQSRWVWVIWATAVGLTLGSVFQLTGSLVGPIVAHALVNAVNLSYLKSYDPLRRRALGGLLGQQPNG